MHSYATAIHNHAFMQMCINRAFAGVLKLCLGITRYLEPLGCDWIPVLEQFNKLLIGFIPMYEMYALAVRNRPVSVVI